MPHPSPVPLRIVSPTSGRAVAPRRVRANRGEGNKLREQILVAAERLLLEKGDAEAVSIRAVADVVGCTPPAIYLHFADKAELLFEVCSHQFRVLQDRLDDARDGIADPLERLAAGSKAYIRFGLDHPAHYRVLFMGKPVLTPEQFEDLRLSGVAGFHGLVDGCRAAISSGGLRAGDPHLMAVGLWALCHGLVTLMIAKPKFEWPPLEATIDHLVDTHLNGLSR